MKRGAFACFAAALVLSLFCAAPAEAAVRLRAYDVTITPGPGGKLHYHLGLQYQATGEKKTEGFKYVGRTTPENLRAYDPDGQPLSVRWSHEGSSGEYRLDYAIPPPAARGAQRVDIEFDQAPPSAGYGWSGTRWVLSWVHVFKIPVDWMNVSITWPGSLSADGFDCAAQGGQTTCTRTTSAPASVSVWVPRSAWLALGVLIAIAATACASIAAGARKAYQTLVLLKGILPAATTAAYAEAGNYRAPPELPVQQEAVTPVLPTRDRNAFLARVVGSYLLVIGFALAVAIVANGRSPIPIAFAVGIAVAAAAIPAFACVRSEGKTWLWYVALPVSAAGFAVVGIIGAGAGLGVLGLGALSKVNWAAAGSGGGSSCSSGSSCGGGGGGGGCGGGGGGGGCGG